MKKYTSRQIRCGIGTDAQEWVAVDDIEKMIEILKKDIEYNSSDFGEVGKIIKIKYLMNIINNLSKKLGLNSLQT